MQLEAKRPRTLSLRDVAQVLCRRRWALLGILIPTVCVVLVGSTLTLNVYEASAKIILKQERFALLHVPNEDSKPHIKQEIDEQALNSQIELLRSRSVLEAVVDEHQLHRRPMCPPLRHQTGLLTRLRSGICQVWHTPWFGAGSPDASKRPEAGRGKAIGALNHHLDIIPIKQSSLILVSYRDRDPVLAARVVNSLIEHFRNRDVQLNQSDGAYELYRGEAETLRDSLVQSEHKLQQFRQQSGIINLDKQKELNLIKLAEFEGDLRRVEAEIAATQEEIQRLNMQVATQPERIETETRVMQNNALGSLKATLMMLEVRRSQLRKKFKPGHHLLHEVESQIEEAKRVIAQESSTRIQEQSTQRNPMYKLVQESLLRAETKLSGLVGRRRVLKQHVEDYHQLSQHLDQMSFELSPLSREAELKTQAYTIYLRKEEEARFAHAMDQRRIGNLSVAEPAYVPMTPVGPNRKLNMLLALLVGTIAGLGMAYVVDYNDHTFKTRDEIEQQLGVRLLASVPVRKQWQ